MDSYRLNSNMQFDYFDDGEAILYDLDTEKIYILNITAASIVKLIFDKCDDLLSEYIKTMSEKYPNVSDTVLVNDYQELLHFLTAEKIIVSCNTADGC